MVRAVAFFLILVLVALFALINWGAFSAPTALSLGFMTVQAPLGLIMLGLVVFLSLLFTVWVISLQGAALAATRRQTRELQAQRELADRAEASRFTELRADMAARFEQTQAQMRTALEQQANAVAAHVGQLEDRLERGRLLPPPQG